MMLLSDRINQWLLLSIGSSVFMKAQNVGGILCSIKDNCVSSLVTVNWGLATILLAMLFVYTYWFPGGHCGACPSLLWTAEISWLVFDCWYVSIPMNCPRIISWWLLGWTMEDLPVSLKVTPSSFQNILLKLQLRWLHQYQSWLGMVFHLTVTQSSTGYPCCV